MDPQPSLAGSIPVDAKAIVRQRLAVRQRRTRRLRRTVAAAAVTIFAALWTVIYVQLASGHDPVLSANVAAVATPISTTTDTAAAQALRAKLHELALKHRAVRAAAQAKAAAAAASAAAATTTASGSGSSTNPGTTSSTSATSSSPVSTTTASTPTPTAQQSTAAPAAVTTSQS